MIDARRGVLGLGLVLILIGRAAGLVLPWSTKIMIDDVLGDSRADLLELVPGAFVDDPRRSVVGPALHRQKEAPDLDRHVLDHPQGALLPVEMGRGDACRVLVEADLREGRSQGHAAGRLAAEPGKVVGMGTAGDLLGQAIELDARPLHLALQADMLGEGGDRGHGSRLRDRGAHTAARSSSSMRWAVCSTVAEAA